MPIQNQYEDWDLTRPPPEGHEDVGKWAYSLFHAAYSEKERAGIPERCYENHRLYRGDHWRKAHTPGKASKDKVTVNLIFSNIQRTVANLTSRNPIAEVHSSDGYEDDADQLMSQKIKNWWNEEEQQQSLARSALGMEIYGTSIEKYVYSPNKNEMFSVVKDPFAIFPAPGYYESVQDLPYICDAYAIPVEEIKASWGVDEVDTDDTYSLLGEDREENVPIPAGTRPGSVNTPGNYSPVLHPRASQRDYKEARGLVIEVWIKDDTEIQQEVEEVANELNGATTITTQAMKKYPDGIRKITICNRGELVLDDSPNPNLNWVLPEETIRKTYAWGRLPFAKSCSYDDAFSFWGFSAADQVGDIQLKINELISRIGSYIARVCMPPLILPKTSGVKKEQITNLAGLIIQPDNELAAQGIRFLEVPNLPSNFFQLLEMYIGFFDRVYAIQDVDRGETPKNIEAASAIITLQERNAVLMRQKIRAVDYLVRERGRWRISFLQNFSWREETITVQEAPKLFRGIDYAGRQFDFVVESGSTVAKTSLQNQADAKELFQLGVIDRQALLENLNFPDWKAILERTAEGQLAQALQVLVQAGLPPEQAQYLAQFLAQPQMTPVQSDSTNVPSGGTPRAQQGQMPVNVPNPTQPNTIM